MFRQSKLGDAPPRRRRTILFASLGAVALGAFAIACGDSPSAPGRPLASAAASTSSADRASTTTTTVTTLLWDKNVSEKTETAVIGPQGGVLSIPAGVRLVVPRGAVSSRVTFSVTRLAGSIVAYDFEPHGMTFAKPLTIEQPTLGTNLFRQPAIKQAEGAYFLDRSSLNPGFGTADVAEFEPTFISADRAWITFTVKHFSGYLVSMGRDRD